MPDGTGKTTSAASTTPEKRRNRVAPTSGCPIPPKVGEKATGTDLRATTLTYSAHSFNRDVMLSDEALAALPEALSTEEFLSMDRAFLKGAYAAGGAYAQVSLENTTGARMSVFDVRPVNIVVECMPLAALVTYGNEGGDPAQMVFNMDAEAPMPRSMNERGELGRPYFEEFPSIELAGNAKSTFLLTFTTEVGAYSFELMISYEINGKKARTMLRNGFVPYRVAAGLCPSPEARLAMSPDEAEHMKALRFRHIRQRGANMTISSQSPEEWGKDCPTW